MLRQIFMSTIFKNGQFTIPVKIREKWGLKPGDKINFILNDNEIIMRAQLVQRFG